MAKDDNISVEKHNAPPFASVVDCDGANYKATNEDTGKEAWAKSESEARDKVR